MFGPGTTGYSKDRLQKVLSADIAPVETVAHARSSLRPGSDVDTIIDLGDQEIKIILLRHGKVRDFKLNSQGSAGNGYFPQAAADPMGIPVQQFAETAFRARRRPQFSDGCAVFLLTDVVNVQRQGWGPDEIVAGVATVFAQECISLCGWSLQCCNAEPVFCSPGRHVEIPYKG